MEDVKVELTLDDLKIFYAVAYMEGFDGKNVCGGMGKLEYKDVDDIRISRSYIKFLQEKSKARKDVE